MSVYFVLSETNILVKGKTYPYRDHMRSLGAQYNAVEKSWTLPLTPENEARVSELCKSVGGGEIKESTFSPKVSLGRSSELASSRPTSLSTYKAPSLPDLGFETETRVTEVPQGLSIAELMRQAQLAIAQSFPRSVWVIGEIQNIRFHASGVYFQLADSKEGASQSATVTVNATLWNSQLRDLTRKFGDTLKEVLQDGFRVRVLADLTIFKDRGQLSLQIQSIDPNFTKGSLALQREKLLKELRAKGLDRKNKALKLSSFPLKIGLLSAEDSRAKSDFLDQLKVYGFPGDVVFRACQMQGEATLRDVVSGLAFLQEARVDLIVMTRGGGSAADLRWFDSSEIAYAIAECTVPVVAAIGHHEDVCVAEDICYQREKTPTAAADFIISVFQKTRERLDQLSLSLDKLLNDRVKLFETYLMTVMEKMRSAAQTQLSDNRRLLDQSEATLELNWQRRLFQWASRLDQIQDGIGRGMALRLEREKSRLDHIQNALGRGMALRYEREKSLLDRASTALHTRAGVLLTRFESVNVNLSKDLRRASLDANREREMLLQKIEAFLRQKDPKPWMKQGWTQLFNDKGLIKSGSQIEAGESIKARLPDSLLHLKVTDIETPKGGQV